MKEMVKDYRAKMIEKVSEATDELTEKFLNGQALTKEEIKAAIRILVLKSKMYPVLCGSALSNIGVQLMLDAVTWYLPSPLDMPPVKGINPDTELEETRQADDNLPFSALAFKIATD